MRKILLSVLTLAVMAFSSSAVTNMCVKTDDGTVVRYDVEHVSEVYYEEIASTDTAQGVSVSGKVGNYTYVDLGLASGTKWATYNVGASKPSEYGDYFAWGETEPKEDYSERTYKWSNDSYITLTKYCSSSSYGTVDGLTTLLAEDDAATANWGSGWRMPTTTEQKELIEGCDWEWTKDFNGSGVAGEVGTSKTNGNTIFLPAAGRLYGTDLDGAGYYGNYWSSSIKDGSGWSYGLLFNSGGVDRYNGYRFVGPSVRAVVNSTQQEEQQDANKPDSTSTNVPTDTTGSNIESDTTGTSAQGVSVSGKVGNYTYVDLGLESGTKWATCNVGASKPSEYGDYFAWGETSPKENYDWSTYRWCKGSFYTQTKYCVGSIYGTVDNLTTLLAEDDAATANWGSVWRMPTTTEQQELLDGCDWEWTKNFNGSEVAGYIGTSKTNGNTIFLPAAGYLNGTGLLSAGLIGYYWSSSLDEYNSFDALAIVFDSDYLDWGNYDRFIGQSVRAVVK